VLVPILFDAFASEVRVTPSITLRGGNDLDEHRDPSPFDPTTDSISDTYFLQYHWGLNYVDAESWRHYLPHLIEYALRNLEQADIVVDALLNSLRPPDRVPPRLTSLSPEQEGAITQFLDWLAFSANSAHQDLACQVLEEWWIPGALYRLASGAERDGQLSG
jgi:hypothetical protein